MSAISLHKVLLCLENKRTSFLREDIRVRKIMAVDVLVVNCNHRNYFPLFILHFNDLFAARDLLFDKNQVRYF